jgi:hypothetical protein
MSFHQSHLGFSVASALLLLALTSTQPQAAVGAQAVPQTGPWEGVPESEGELRLEVQKALQVGDEAGALRRLEALGRLRHSKGQGRASLDALVLQATAQAAIRAHEQGGKGLLLALGLHGRQLETARFGNVPERVAALQVQALLTERLLGDRSEAKRLYARVLEADSGHRGAREALARLAAAAEADKRWAEENELARLQGKARQ